MVLAGRDILGTAARDATSRCSELYAETNKKEKITARPFEAVASLETIRVIRKIRFIRMKL
jgi:hypothetical protein